MYIYIYKYVCMYIYIYIYVYIHISRDVCIELVDGVYYWIYTMISSSAKWQWEILQGWRFMAREIIGVVDGAQGCAWGCSLSDRWMYTCTYTYTYTYTHTYTYTYTYTIHYRHKEIPCVHIHIYIYI